MKIRKLTLDRSLPKHQEASKTQDITGGLPRVAELFEHEGKEGNVGQMAKIDVVSSRNMAPKSVC